jgi:hypothetical protein
MNKKSFARSIAGFAFAIAAVGCTDKPPEKNVGLEEKPDKPAAAAESVAPVTTPAGNVTVADITGSLTNYAGRTVTVVADVEEVLGPRAFKLDEDNALAGGIDNDMLVLSPKAGALANFDDQWLNNKVRVTGAVHRAVVIDIEREIGWDLDPDIEAELQEVKAVLVATAVEKVQK